MKHFFKNKRGMTYVELLVAFTLLVLVVFVFSPMLLSSYSSLYDAGARTENTYKAKSEIEEGLAERLSTKIVPFNANFENFITNVDINGRKIASSYQDDLETMFRGARAKVNLVSPSTVYDDASYHDVIIQTTNIVFDKCTVGYTAPASGSKNIHIAVLFPDKTAGANNAGDEEFVYNYKSPIPATVDEEKITYNAASGRITFRIEGCDFTKSPVKITVFFRDEKDKPQSVSCFLYIKAPTIMAVGKTAYSDYYTTAGVETVINHKTNGTTENVNTLTVEGRDMPTANSSIVQGNTPKDNTVTLQNVSFVNNDSDGTLDPYYVITGDKGAVYRMYILKNSPTSDSTKDLTITDKIYKLDDGSKVYPALWSGDYTNQFFYTVFKTDKKFSVDYGGKGDRSSDRCWQTEDSKNRGTGTQTFTTRATYSYFRNGLITDFTYRMQGRRQISYILNEWGCALRFHGAMDKWSDFSGYHSVWNLNINENKNNSQISSWEHAYHSTGNNDLNRYNKLSSLAVVSMSTGNLKDLLTDVDDGDIDKWFNTAGNAKKDYSSESNVRISDAVFVPSLNRILYVGSIDANCYILQQDNDYSYKSVSYAGDYDDKPTGGTTGYCVYGTTKTDGTTIYKASDATGDINRITTLGMDPKFLTDSSLDRAYTVNGVTHYATYQRQHDSHYVGTSGCWCALVNVGYNATALGWNNHTRNGWSTLSYADVMKLSSGERNEWFKRPIGDPITEPNWDTIIDAQLTLNSSATEVTASNYTAANSLTESNNVLSINEGNAVNDSVNGFYTSMKSQNIHLNDLYFTLGYSSNREFIFSRISYGKTDKNGDGKLTSADDDNLYEKYKSYEEYYFLSHYGNAAHQANYTVQYNDGKSITNLKGHEYWNNVDNDYYNVWFPGECYSITKTAECEGVVVGVGYAVSGSTYQWLDIQAVSGADHVNNTNNSSTALGGIFNDGVLAVCTPGDTSFNNKLYFKDNATMDTDFLSDSATNATPSVSWSDGTNGSKSIYYNLAPASAASYTTAFGGNYGTHARQSVRFTAVDLMVESSGSGETENKSYYAYYGDSTGRVFKSLVATASATGSASSGSVNPVSYIADLTAADSVKNASGAGKMEQVSLTGLTGDNANTTQYFSEIVSITAGEDLVVITGKVKPGVSPCVIIGCYEEKTVGDEIVRGDFVWKVVHLIGAGYEIQDGVIVNGYYYACGVNSSKGFVLAADLETLKKTAKNATVSGTMVTVTDDPLYSISGRA